MLLIFIDQGKVTHGILINLAGLNRFERPISICADSSIPANGCYYSFSISFRSNREVFRDLRMGYSG